MKTPTRETIAVGTTGDGTVVFYNPYANPDIRHLSTDPAGNDLDDLTRFVRIPTLSAFVHELLAEAQDAKEERP